MSRWSQSNYEGPMENGWPQGKGKYIFPNGTIYEGEFDKGEFHGDGILRYPKKGKYVAKWDRGKMMDGKYFFSDEMEHQKELFAEGSRGVGADVLNLNINDVQEIPEGTYDVGDGYYDPVKKAIFDYNGNILRELDEEEGKLTSIIKSLEIEISLDKSNLNHFSQL